MLLNQVRGFKGITFTNATITLVAFVNVFYNGGFGK